jgi:hypothetical protein
MSSISPYGTFTGRRLYSTSKIDNEIEEILHRLSKLEYYEQMPTNPNQSPWVSQRMGHNSRAEWLREAKEWERGLVGTEDDRKLKQRILDRILRVEGGKARVSGHLALIPGWKKIGGRTFKRYFGIDFVGGKHMVMMPDSLRRAMTGGLINATTTTSGFQEAINYLSTQGTTSTYAKGGVLEVIPGTYTSSSVWQLPATNFDFTMKGGGKSNTFIEITPTGTQTAAIAEGYTSWLSGTMGPRFVLRDLSMNITGTYSGTTAPAGDSSGGGVVSLQFCSVFLSHVGMSINTPTLTTPCNLLKCGTYAGPSQPCDWDNFEIEGYTGSGMADVVAVWFEGFSWRGGLVELDAPGVKGGGIAIRSNGPNYLGQIDSYDPGNPTANNWSAFVTPSGTTTLDEIEYPFLANIGTTTGCGSVYGGSGNPCITIIGIMTESAIAQGDPTAFGFWNGGCKYLKTIGFSLGLQSGAQWISGYLTGPWNNNVASVGYLVGTNTYNGVTAPTASTTYHATTDLLVNSSGGTGVSITISDQLGNAILTGLTSLSAFRMSIGMQINFGAFTASPTVSIYQVSG